MSLISRRTALVGLFAPAIVQATNIMPVKALLEYDEIEIYLPNYKAIADKIELHHFKLVYKAMLDAKGRLKIIGEDRTVALAV